MKLIKLSKVEKKECEVLQNAVVQFMNSRNKKLRELATTNPNEFLNNLLLFDNAKRLFYFFRGKTESLKKEFTLSFNVGEAIVMMQICDEFAFFFDDYHSHTLRKTKEIMFQQIINL
ncbi:hypothetical protein ACI6PS_03505 [Flavobacterium sp. PLA-1-15]|uniref:hypothetical protein n=1 Tax=Flavobacterium sp. PLA-1-15 TaxID=3380533 RepID=UPI003B7E2D6D